MQLNSGRRRTIRRGTGVAPVSILKSSRFFRRADILVRSNTAFQQRSRISKPPTNRELPRTRMSARQPGGGLPLWLAVGHFILRAPARMARTELPVFLARVAAEPRDGSDRARVARLTRRWLRLPLLRSRDTCYLRSLVLFRFVDPRGGELSLHFGVDEPRDCNERLHGHAWVSLDGVPLNPPATLTEGRLKEIYRFSKLTGGSSTSGATLAVAMIRSADVPPALAQPVPA